LGFVFWEDTRHKAITSAHLFSNLAPDQRIGSEVLGYFGLETRVIGKVQECEERLDYAVVDLYPNEAVSSKSLMGIKRNLSRVGRYGVDGFGDNAEVFKVGASTGLSFGYLIVKQGLVIKIGPSDRFENQTDELTLSGDSGSVWVLNTPGELLVVGLQSFGDSDGDPTDEYAKAVDLFVIEEDRQNLMGKGPFTFTNL